MGHVDDALAVWLSCNGVLLTETSRRGVQMRLPPRLLAMSCSTTERHIQPSIMRYVIRY